MGTGPPGACSPWGVVGSSSQHDKKFNLEGGLSQQTNVWDVKDGREGRSCAYKQRDELGSCVIHGLEGLNKRREKTGDTTYSYSGC